MDADDHASPERLAIQLEKLTTSPELDVVASRVQYCGSILNNYGYFFYVQSQNKIMSYSDIYLNQFAESPFAHPSVMFRKRLIDRYGPYLEGNFPEDYELWLRWLSEGVKMEKLPDLLVDWYDDESRLSRTGSRYSREGFYRIKAFYFSLWYQKLPVPRRRIWVWGAGKTVRRRSAWLTCYKLPIEGFIDIKQSGCSTYTTCFFQEFHFSADVLILVYVSDRKGKKEIHNYLTDKGKKEGLDFWMMA